MIFTRNLVLQYTYILGQYVNLNKEKIMKWSAPQASDMRFGFEITMYIANR